MATSIMEHEPHGVHQTRKATASGWIGSALEYYDFFIYATAAALVFPQVFFPKGDPAIAIIASLATYGVGYVARPIGAFVLGHLGDTRGRKQVLAQGTAGGVGRRQHLPRVDRQRVRQVGDGRQDGMRHFHR